MKVEKWWQGPYQVVQRVGGQSYQIRTDKCLNYDVHRDQLKSCTWDPDLGEWFPLVFRRSDPSEQREAHRVVDQILNHRVSPVRGLEFLTHWSGTSGSATAWEPVSNFLHGCPEAWMRYCYEKNLTMDLLSAIQSIGDVSDAWLTGGEE